MQLMLGILQLQTGSLSWLGLDPRKDVTPQTTDKAVQIWSSVVHTNDSLKEMGVMENDKLLLFQSLRYTKASLEETLKENVEKYQLFDTGSPFVATLIKT